MKSTSWKLAICEQPRSDLRREIKNLPLGRYTSCPRRCQCHRTGIWIHIAQDAIYCILLLGKQLQGKNRWAPQLTDGSWGQQLLYRTVGSYFLTDGSWGSNYKYITVGSYFLGITVGAGQPLHLLNSWALLLKGGSWGSNYICWTVGLYFLRVAVGAATTYVEQLGSTS
jgi:hypothetical protein